VPTAPVGQAPSLPYPHWRLPYPYHIQDNYTSDQWVPLEDDETAEGWSDWYDHPDFVPFYDDPEFTLFSSKPLPGFQSAQQLLHSVDVRDSSHSPDGIHNINFRAQDNEEEDFYGDQLSNNPVV